MNVFEFSCNHKTTNGFHLEIDVTSNHLVTALFGPSGSGKTSVLEMMAGLRSPDHGKIILNGRVLLDTEREIYAGLSDRHVGMVFQDHLIFPHLNVEKNLLYGLKRSKRKEQLSVERVVQVLDLESLLTRYPRQLSGGEKQRVALGRAILYSPEILLLDEPLSALDDDLKDRILRYIERIVEEWQIPLVLVSHSQMEVRRLSDWVFVLDEGKVVAEGSPDDALMNRLTLEWKNSMAPMNLLKVQKLRMENGAVLGKVGDQFFQIPKPDDMAIKEIYVGFAPNAVLLSRHDISDISARNHLCGVVRNRMDGNGIVYLAVDVGQIMWVEVTAQAVEDLNITIGSEVVCFIKVRSLIIID